MSQLRVVDLGATFHPFSAIRDQLGYVPNLFRAQSLLPDVIGAEVDLLDAVLFKQGTLSRVQKECILLMVAVANGNPAGVAIHYQMLRLLSVSEQRLEQILTRYQETLSPVNAALISLALKVASSGTYVSLADVRELSRLGLTHSGVLEAVLTSALGCFLCTVGTGLGIAPDFPPPAIAPTGAIHSAEDNGPEEGRGTFVNAPEISAEDFSPFAFLQALFGFVPGVFRAQTLRPDAIIAEARLVRTLMQSEELLTRVQKDCILLGRCPDESQERNGALAAFADRLAQQPSSFGRDDIDALRHEGFSDEHILQTIGITALARFLSVLQSGLGAAPDLRLRSFQAAPSKKVYLLDSVQRHTSQSVSSDPDMELVGRIRGGDLDAFETLMNRHSQRLYRTLICLLGDPEEARDALQDTFLKAFQHLASFEGRSKFSTWLVSIAGNTGVQKLRERRNVENLDEWDSESEEGFRPRQVQAWTNDPEQLYSQSERRALIESGIMKLPAKYRVVLMLRDIEHVSVEEAATALGLGIPALKARLLRGRLMLRETLAPHFIESKITGRAKGVPFG